MTVSGNWVDRDRLIESLANCAHERNCQKCLYWQTEHDCRDAMLLDVSELLKEQEAVKLIEPIYQGDDSYVCENCGETVGWEEMECYGIGKIRYKYCPGCGRKVKWE